MAQPYCLATVSAAMAALLATVPASAGAAPRFEDFPVSAVHRGATARPLLADAQSRNYATQLRHAAAGKADFAGRYVLATWGCGASCTMSAAIDAKTGAVSWLPFTVCCRDADVDAPLDYKLTSRLLIVHGARNEQGGGTHYYQFDGKRFAEIPTP
ncbi:hypothetical protein INH39_08930 [Massilia violaceinigra]|uniref:Lipoprotein n=1 Tax=Massilia violaceinigra TaxID=2045208 RepID=A0ABY4AAF3_9BURK|nr:hypothetical protein [Massilia violaceinigra]UOD31788.1 hypothetical protein INH39_08930 [Massilia violaceinigra]